MNPPFHHPAWIADTNIYEVNLRQYTREGTFAAFAREMPRLRDMGIETLWFMPITPISLDKRKGSLGSYYACSDYTATNPEFGTIDDFTQLVQSAHALGFKVIIDWVANHTGWDHHWTREHPEYYRKNLAGNFFEAHGWEDVIDLDYDNAGLRAAMVEAMSFWVKRCDIDGFRCDMAMLVPLDFWRGAREALDKQKELFWLAECEEVNYHEVFDATYAWRWLHKMEAVWRHESGLDGLDEVLRSYDREFPPDAIRAYFTSNHDENSHSGSEYERIGDAAKAFAVFCCTWHGVPLIYSGQELPNLKRLQFFDKDPIEWTGQYALHGFYKELLTLRKRNPALRAVGDASTGAAPASGGGGAASGGAVVGGTGTGSSGAAPASSGGGAVATAGDVAVTTQRITDGIDIYRSFAFLRKNGENEVLVVLNLSTSPLVVPLERLRPGGVFQQIFGGEALDLAMGGTIELPAWGFLVLEKI